jgi:hypothetical protein
MSALPVKADIPQHPDDVCFVPGADIAHSRDFRVFFAAQEGAPNASTLADEHFMQALNWARRQGALSWELRTMTSLARLWQRKGRKGEAHSSLAAVYGRFSEGFATADLRAAKLLLYSLS